MFQGLSAVNLDAKGRFSIPKRYRDSLKSQASLHLMATIDTEDACLLIYPLARWEQVQSQLQALPSFNKVARRIQRLLIGHAHELDIDMQGRVLIPPLLREYANLQKKAFLVGQGQKCELWSCDMWEKARHEWLKDKLLQSEDLPDAFNHLTL